MDEFVDLVVVSLYALAAGALAILSGATGAVALVIQAPIVLFLPGYAIMSAALPASTLDRLERLTLSLGLSIAVTILGGLALNLAPAGLDRYSWSVLLTLVIVGSSSVAMLRRARRRAAIPPQLSQNPEIPGVPAATVGAGVMGIGHGLRGLLTTARLRAFGLGLALLIMTGAVIFSRESAMDQPHPGFTQLWMLPGQASNGQPSVQIGIVNDETGTMRYTLVLKRDQETIRHITDIALTRHGTWEETILIVPGSKQALIEGDLYLTGQATPLYRSVKVWIAPARNGT